MFETLVVAATLAVGGPLALALLAWIAGVRYIPHGRVGIVERLWSPRGSLADGRILAVDGEAGFQADLLRGGLHLGLFPFAYRVHTAPLVAVPQGRIGYVYARDGHALDPTQSLGRVVGCNDFQDARAFLGGGGQRGRQRAILREGVYAINLAQFVVLTEECVFSAAGDVATYDNWREELKDIDAFVPVRVGGQSDTLGVVTVHDGPPLATGEIIAPEVLDHACFQEPDVFLAHGGRRGRQLQVLTDGSFFLNRWFATVELKPKTVIPIGYVGVVVSYHGRSGEDVTGEGFRYGEQVESGQRGVWKRALPPGKYALNPFALKVELVPTVNFVLRWITGQVEAHEYDKDLVSLELITADGYEPMLPLSLVLHIDYEKAPRVVQRFGDVKRLISQTLDPILSAYFRDVAQSCHMLDLLLRREEIQTRATEELGRRFKDYDINCVAVMIGRPEAKAQKGEDPIERLFDQLRTRRLAEEQVATFGKQEEAATRLRALKRVEAEAAKQTELTQTEMDVSIVANRGQAKLQESRLAAEGEVLRADGEARARSSLAKADAQNRVAIAHADAETRVALGRADAEAKLAVGRADAEVVSRTGLASAAVALRQVRAFGDPRLVAVQRAAEALRDSRQPLVPERLVGAAGDGVGPLGQLLQLLLAEKAGAAFADDPALEADVTKLEAELGAPVPEAPCSPRNT